MKGTYGKRRGLSAFDVGARRVAPTYGKQALVTLARKAGRIVVVDHEAERLTSHMLGLDPSVLSYQPQPFTVDLIGRAILRTQEERLMARRRYKDLPGPTLYTPDYVVTLSGGLQRAVEVKLQGYTGDDAYREKLNTAASILHEHGYEFVRVVVPESANHPLRANVPLLHQASLRLDLRPTPEVFDHIEQLAADGAQTLAAFSSGLGMSPSMMPILLVFGALSVDLHTWHIRNVAPAQPAFGSLDHLQLLWRLAQ
jgi:hypothetical protein